MERSTSLLFGSKPDDTDHPLSVSLEHLQLGCSNDQCPSYIHYHDIGTLYQKSLWHIDPSIPIRGSGMKVHVIILVSFLRFPYVLAIFTRFFIVNDSS